MASAPDDYFAHEAYYQSLSLGSQDNPMMIIGTTNNIGDPMNDACFRRIFGRNQEVAIAFLNETLDLQGEDRIKHLSFFPTILQADHAMKKETIVDVLCADAAGNNYILEMQVANLEGFEQRAQFYSSKVYSLQANQGTKYHELLPVTYVAVVNYDIFPLKTCYKTIHTITDDVTQKRYLKDFKYIFISIPKFNPKEKILQPQDHWPFFLKYAQNITAAELFERTSYNRNIKRAYYQLNMFHWTKQEIYAYTSAMEFVRQHQAMYDFAEDKAKEKVAIKLLKLNADLNLIVQCTGFQMEKIIELRNNSLIEKKNF